MKKTLKYIPIVVLGISAPLFAEDSATKELTEETAEKEMASEEQPKMSIIDTALANEELSTLVTAVKAAGLVEALSGEGPMTVFAPTNEAFEKLPEGTLEMLLKPENKEKLVAILMFHAVDGKVMSTDLATSEVKTLNGAPVNVVVAEEKVTVDGATVINADVETSNGVVHVIDTVLLPE